jgi:[acyl-carrier-protein] S-malonyltransferase
MKRAIIFPGQGAQHKGMGKDLYDSNENSKSYFHLANEILGFNIAEIMFSGSDEELLQTKVTQPAIFIHSVLKYFASSANFIPDAVAGHSLGEFSALVINKTLRFEDALQLVQIRANAMQKACEILPSTMAAVLKAEDSLVQEVCNAINDEIVVPANYNCPGQIVISGSINGVRKAAEILKNKGAKAIILQVRGAFHSPFMEPALQDLKKGIEQIEFKEPVCPIYQNVNALPAKDASIIKQNLINQLTSPVLWTQTIQNMVNDGIKSFVECGPGNVLQGLVKKCNSQVEISSMS